MANADIQIRFFPTSVGGCMLVHAGFEYTKKNGYKDTIYWRWSSDHKSASKTARRKKVKTTTIPSNPVQESVRDALKKDALLKARQEKAEKAEALKRSKERVLEEMDGLLEFPFSSETETSEDEETNFEAVPTNSKRHPTMAVKQPRKRRVDEEEECSKCCLLEGEQVKKNKYIKNLEEQLETARRKKVKTTTIPSNPARQEKAEKAEALKRSKERVLEEMDGLLEFPFSSETETSEDEETNFEAVPTNSKWHPTMAVKQPRKRRVDEEEECSKCCLLEGEQVKKNKYIKNLEEQLVHAGFEYTKKNGYKDTIYWRFQESVRDALKKDALLKARQEKAEKAEALKRSKERVLEEMDDLLEFPFSSETETSEDEETNFEAVPTNSKWHPTMAVKQPRKRRVDEEEECSKCCLLEGEQVKKNKYIKNLEEQLETARRKKVKTTTIPSNPVQESVRDALKKDALLKACQEKAEKVEALKRSKERVLEEMDDLLEFPFSSETETSENEETNFEAVPTNSKRHPTMAVKQPRKRRVDEEEECSKCCLLEGEQVKKNKYIKNLEEQLGW
ncbi:myosin-11-like [Haliotis asinina]|uniref:myosin-11-like n=1 Tax=Haliotis asinina TaxID=109174 RepID=UPI003532450C